VSLYLPALAHYYLLTLLRLNPFQPVAPAQSGEMEQGITPITPLALKDQTGSNTTKRSSKIQERYLGKLFYESRPVVHMSIKLHGMHEAIKL
jgi:hypothetical protein